MIFIEHKLLYMTEGEVPDEPYLIPLGEAEVKRAGHGRDARDVVAHDPQEPPGRRGARGRGHLGRGHRPSDAGPDGHRDGPRPRSAEPDAWSIAQEAVKRGGVGSDIAAQVVERAFDSLKAPIARVAGANTVIPFNLGLEKAMVPQVADIAAAVRGLLGKPVEA